MSIRCSLLGHTYGEEEIEREREEQGTEVVVTVREFKECERCGERSVVSENVEVTTLEIAESDRRNPDENATASGSEGRTGRQSGGSAADATTSPSVENEFERPHSADEDDAIILDDAGSEAGDGDGSGGSDSDRQPGEWPDADSTHPAETDADEPAAWPEVGQDDQGFDAEVDDGASADVEFGGGLQPESAPEVNEDDEEVEFVNAEGDTLRASEGGSGGSNGGRRADLSAGFTSSGSIPSPDGPSDEPAPDAEFVCPECDHRASISGSSLRAGDICPECRRGYIARE